MKLSETAQRDISLMLGYASGSADEAEEALTEACTRPELAELLAVCDEMYAEEHGITVTDDEVMAALITIKSLM